MNYYAPIQEIETYLVDKYKHCKKILEVGPGSIHFPISTHFVDHVEISSENRVGYTLNICENKLPFEDKEFDFVYCRHVLEDIHNPDFVFNEIKRVSKAGYIETPSPLVEVTKGVDVSGNPYRGYLHHRYIIWNSNDNVLKMIPKFPILEHAVVTDEQNIEKLKKDHLAWNSYFLWDDSELIKHKMYYYAIDYDLRSEYGNMLMKAIDESQTNTEWMRKLINIA